MEGIKLPAYKKGKSGERYNYSYTISDSYEEYAEVNGRLAVDKKMYVSILKDFFWELSKLIITERYHFKIPFRLGYIRIKKNNNFKDLSKNKIDFNYYNKTGKFKYYLNTHTDNQYFYWAWDFRKFKYGNFKNMPLYKFYPNRGQNGEIGKKGLSDWIKKCASDPTLKDYDVI